MLLVVSVMSRGHPIATPFPYTTLFRSGVAAAADELVMGGGHAVGPDTGRGDAEAAVAVGAGHRGLGGKRRGADRDSTRLDSSHTVISYAVSCLESSIYRD